MADISSSLPTQDKADGTAGSPSATVLSVQGVSSGTPVSITSRVAQSPSSPTTVSVGITSTSVLAANASRTGLVLVNTSNSIISVGLGTAAVLKSGITLYPGGTFTMDQFSFSTGTITAIASLASSGLAVQEYS